MSKVDTSFEQFLNTDVYHNFLWIGSPPRHRFGKPSRGTRDLFRCCWGHPTHSDRDVHGRSKESEINTTSPPKRGGILPVLPDGAILFFQKMIEICILAGGHSSRMGSNKAEILLGGRPMLAHVHETAASIGCGVRVISDDIQPGCGPLGGVVTAWETSTADTLLFLSCDMPFVSVSLLTQVRDRLRPPATAVFTLSTSPGFPFHLDRRSQATVQEMVATGPRSLKELARRLDAELISLPDSRHMELCNVNTATDLEQARNFLTLSK